MESDPTSHSGSDSAPHPHVRPPKHIGRSAPFERRIRIFCLLIAAPAFVLAAILLFSAAIGATATGTRHTFAEESAPGWELTAHILLSMGAAALLFAGAASAFPITIPGLTKPKPAAVPAAPDAAPTPGVYFIS